MFGLEWKQNTIILVYHQLLLEKQKLAHISLSEKTTKLDKNRKFSIHLKRDQNKKIYKETKTTKYMHI